MQENRVRKAKLQMIISTAAFGTIGIFRRWITLPSSALAMTRGLIGALFLLSVHLIKKTPFDKTGIRKNGVKLVLSGALIGFNWITLFESYNYTSVAKATLYYYFAPIFLIILSVIFLKEKLSKKKVLCIGIAVIGIVFVSGVLEGSTVSNPDDSKGFMLGILSGAMYGTVMFINKAITGIDASDKTLIQIATAGTVMLIYGSATGDFSGITLTPLCIIMVLIVGIFHTGFCYTLFFGSMDVLSAQTVAIFTYIDPAVAVILSALLLKEPLSIQGIIGAILVIGSALISEL